MRVQVSINDKTPTRASLAPKGWLSVHLNLSGGDSPEDSPASLYVQAIDYADEPNSVNSIWEIGELRVGDTARVDLLSDGEADPPTRVERSTELSTNLFSNVDQARQLLSAISAFDKELAAIAEHSRPVEPQDEFNKIARAIGSVFVELDRNLIQPTLRRHPELLAEAQEKHLI